MTGITKIQLKQLLMLILAWQMAAILISIYDHFVMHFPGVTIHDLNYTFTAYLAFNMIAALIGGLIAGPVIIFWVNEKFNDKPYGWSIITVVIAFLVVTSFVILFIGIFYIAKTTNIPFGTPEYWMNYREYIFNIFQLKKLLVWAVIVAITEFALQLDRKFGHGILWKIILGRYHSPKKEYRIFMFADLDNSTTIAETIGDEKYHMLLREFFADVTNAIINSKGSIYQYVGDQVIVSWTLEKNNAGSQCIRCFFDMMISIRDKKDKYLKNYGLVPAFKAGIHVGKVIAGEIGIIKRDITYSGDVLNTTSRIQGKCGELGVPLIVSNELLQRVTLFPQFTSNFIGTIKLKGKLNEIGLNAIIQII